MRISTILIYQARCCRRWADTVRGATPRPIFPRRKTPKMAAYTDAAEETGITEANCCGATAFKKAKRTDARHKITAAQRRGRIRAAQ